MNRQSVYPRVCGGTMQAIAARIALLGLSPRVRGNRFGFTPPQKGLRSIPACAGEPRTRLTSSYPSAVYPRVCGGTRRTTSSRRSGNGLSPRVRGNRGCLCSDF